MSDYPTTPTVEATTVVTGVYVIRIPKGVADCHGCDNTTWNEDRKCGCAYCRDCGEERQTTTRMDAAGAEYVMAPGGVILNEDHDWLCQPCWDSERRDTEDHERWLIECSDA